MGFWDRLKEGFVQGFEGDPAERNRSGEEARMKGNYDKAIICFDEAIQLKLQNKGGAYPSLAVIYHGRAKAYQSKGLFDKAIADCTEAIRLEPTSHYYLESRGQCYHQLGDLANGLADLTEAIKHLSPGLPSWTTSPVFTERANIYYKLGEPAKAIADYSEAIRSNEPKDGQSYPLNTPLAISFNNRGMAFLKMGEYDKAVADFCEAIRYEPPANDSYVAFVYNRGSAYLAKKAYEPAVADFAYVIQRLPECIAAYQGRAAAYKELGNESAALKDVQTAEELTKRGAASSTTASSRGANWGDGGAVAVAVAGAAGMTAIFLAAALVKVVIVGGALVAGTAIALANATFNCVHCGERLNPGYNVCPKCGRHSNSSSL
jgi:tetratricopeptide (TPR) repeat protein